MEPEPSRWEVRARHGWEAIIHLQGLLEGLQLCRLLLSGQLHHLGDLLRGSAGTGLVREALCCAEAGAGAGWVGGGSRPSPPRRHLSHVLLFALQDALVLLLTLLQQLQL